MIIHVKWQYAKVNPKTIENRFATLGKVKSVSTDGKGAYVQMPNKKEALRAIKKFNGTRMDGKYIEVKAARTNKVLRSPLGVLRML